MSEETVNLILSLYPAGDPDWVQLIHEDDMWAAQVEAWSSFFTWTLSASGTISAARGTTPGWMA